MKPAIRVENLSKQYRIGTKARPGSHNLTESIVEGASALWRGLTNRTRGGDGADAFWALKDVSFEVQPGEVVGIIGRNGAGKSTLLKILSRIAEPTSGRAVVRGRMASLLEVGTGFHSELTGRENVYLNGSILGMSRQEIDRKFDDIAAFAEIDQFLDTPVKRYSSGMYVRLAFAVAAHLEPDILVVDEVLAVGDAAFQQKCLGRMGQVAQEGRAVLFVSHQMQAVSQLTDRCLVMARGAIAYDGLTPHAIDVMIRDQLSGREGAREYFALATKQGNFIESTKVLTSHKDGVHCWGNPISFEFRLRIDSPGDSLCFSFSVINEQNERLCHWWLLDGDLPYRRRPGSYMLRLRVPRFRLYMGRYSLATWLSERRGDQLHEQLHGLCPFEVSMLGHNRPEYRWEPGECLYLEDGEWLPVEMCASGSVMEDRS